MTMNAITQVLVFFGVLLALVKPLGWYMARVFEGKPFGLGPFPRSCGTVHISTLRCSTNR